MLLRRKDRNLWLLASSTTSPESSTTGNLPRLQTTSATCTTSTETETSKAHESTTHETQTYESKTHKWRTYESKLHELKSYQSKTRELKSHATAHPTASEERKTHHSKTTNYTTSTVCTTTTYIYTISSCVLRSSKWCDETVFCSLELHDHHLIFIGSISVAWSRA